MELAGFCFRGDGTGDSDEDVLFPWQGERATFTMVCRVIGTKKLANKNIFLAGWAVAQRVRFVRGRVGV